MARFAKPIDTQMIESLAKKHKYIVTMEENVASGGLGEKVVSHVAENKLRVKVVTVTIPDEYVEHGNVDILKKEVGIDAQSIADKVIAACGK